MSDKMVETLLAIGNAASWWREQAESMERQRNEAHAEIMKMQAENEQLRAALARPPVASDAVREAVKRLLRETDLTVEGTEYVWDLDSSLPRFEDDITLVARAVLASGERESRLRAAMYGALYAIDRNVYNCFHDLEGNRLDVPHCDSFCEQFGHHTLLDLAQPLREALAASGTAPRTAHQFLPRSGSQTEPGIYTRCGVADCDLAPEQHA